MATSTSTSYSPAPLLAEELISHEEVLETLRYVEENKRDEELVDRILRKARPKYEGGKVRCEGLTYREVSVLLAYGLPERNAEVMKLAEKIKLTLYGNHITLFVPPYLSNYCVDGCIYCPYRAENGHVKWKKLTREEVRQEVIALQGMGCKRLALETGEGSLHNPIGYILECIRVICSIHHKSGNIRHVDMDVAMTTTENYWKLRDVGIDTCTLSQETHHKESYETLHPTGPKCDYRYHTEAMDHAMEDGIGDVGIGMFFGLNKYHYEFAGLPIHAEHLGAIHGVGPHAINVLRLKKASDIDPIKFNNGIDDETLLKIIAYIRIAVPYMDMIISTRESRAVRGKALRVGILQTSGGSRTSIGGYAEEEGTHDTEQFDVPDQRTLDKVLLWLMWDGFLLSFCTVYYREGCTDGRFMSPCKSGQIQDCCHPNALMMFAEYLTDYVSEETRETDKAFVETELTTIPDERDRAAAAENIEEIYASNRRGFRF